MIGGQRIENLFHFNLKSTAEQLSRIEKDYIMFGEQHSIHSSQLTLKLTIHHSLTHSTHPHRGIQ